MPNLTIYPISTNARRAHDQDLGTFGGYNVESSSVIYSMGTALDRAKDQGLPVVVLVGNDWLRGRVVVVDSHGLVLETDAFEHCVVRLEAVNAVRVDAIVHNTSQPVTPMAAAG
jgi:hypothetical protein